MAVTITNAALSGIYERLNSAPTYHPLEAETFSDWAIEAGDIVTVTRGEESYASPVQSTRMVWRGAPEITLNSTGNKERASVSKISRQKYGRGSGAMRNSEEIHNAVYSEDGVLYSLVEQTASSIRTEVGVAISGMAHSVIEQTATYIRTEIENAASSISASVIEQTAEYVRTEVASVASGVAWSVVEQTMTNIQQQIAGRARVYVQWNDPSDDHDMMNGDLWYKKRVNQTWDEIGQESWDALEDYKWQDLYGLKHYVWKNGAWQQVMDTAAIVESEVKVEEDREHWAVLATARDIDNQIYQSNLTVTAQKISSDVSTAQSKIYSTIAQTATNIVSRVENVRSGLQSSIEQTAQSINTSVSAAKSALYSTIEQTATQIRSEVVNTVSGLQSSITQNANMISLVVETRSGTNYIKPASIVAAINDGGSSVVISADHINLDGYVKATDITSTLIKSKIELADIINVSAIAGTTAQAYCHLNEFKGNYYKVNISGGAGSVTTRDLTAGVYDLQITQSGNTYTLQKKDIKASSWTDVGSFSRATSLSGAWSSNTYTVTASPQGNTDSVSPYVQPVSSQGGAYVDLYVATPKSSNPYYDTHGNAKKLYLVSSSGTVYLKDQNSTTQGSVYAQIAGGSSTVTDISFWDANNNRWTGTHDITVGVTLTAYALVNGSWQKGDEVRINPKDTKTDKGSGWYCTVENLSSGGKRCRLTQEFSAGSSVPFTDGNSYHLYT